MEAFIRGSPGALTSNNAIYMKHSITDVRDYSQLTLTQAKRLEMESQVSNKYLGFVCLSMCVCSYVHLLFVYSQVHALELEQELADERTRLAELRKVHYHLGGSQEGWEDTVRILPL